MLYTKMTATSLTDLKHTGGLEHVQLQYDVRDKRAVFPIYDEDNRLIDAVGKVFV